MFSSKHGLSRLLNIYEVQWICTMGTVQMGKHLGFHKRAVRVSVFLRGEAGTLSDESWRVFSSSPQGQYCDTCTMGDSNRAHPITNAIDGTERWWQSPPLSRSVEYNEVNVTLDLGQVGFPVVDLQGVVCFRSRVVLIAICVECHGYSR